MVSIIIGFFTSLILSFYTPLKVLIKGAFFFFAFANIAFASNLILTLNGELPEHIKKNIHAYLGKLPDTELERSAFIYSTKTNINNALQALGYYKAEIVVVTKKQPWQLIVTINLNEPTLLDNIDISITGEAEKDPLFIKLLSEHGLAKGTILHHGKYEDFKSDLLSLALQHGFFNGTLVESIITIKDDYRLADITIAFSSGPRYRFGEVTFSDFELDPLLLTSLIPFKQGDLYSTKTFHQFQYQLQATQYFGSVLAVPENTVQNTEDPQYLVPINVSLTPTKSHHFDFGVGYATDTQLRASIGWRTPLLNKYGHYQETKFEYSAINPTGRFIYSIPLKHPTDDVMQFKITVEGADYADLTTKFYSTQVGKVSRKETWNREIYMRYHQEAWRYLLDEKELNIDWGEEDKVHYYIPGITWSKTIREGSALDPSAGFRQTYNIEAAHLDAGSDNSFFRMHARWNYIKTLQPKHRLVTRAELGAIYIDLDAQIAPSLRFYAGGDQSIRGFDYQSIGTTIPSSEAPNKLNTDKPNQIVVGGTRIIVGSIEYQYYINEKWRVGLFTDGGSVTNKGEFNPVYSFGSGIHYITPVGAVKLDLAYGIDGDKRSQRIHITLGAEL